MNHLSKLFFLGIFLILATGCNEYTTQVCTAANQVDVPGITGNHMIVSYDASTNKMTTTPLTIQRVGVGSYSINGSPLTTCQVGAVVLAEGAVQNHNTFNSYAVTSGPNYFDLVATGLDQAEVNAAGIPNQTITDSNGNKVWVVDNSHVSPQAFVNLLHSTSLVMRVY